MTVLSRTDTSVVALSQRVSSRVNDTIPGLLRW